MSRATDDEIQRAWAIDVFMKPEPTSAEIAQAAGMLGYAFYALHVRERELTQEIAEALRCTWVGKALLWLVDRLDGADR